jgi:hypothetical protein
MRPNSEVPTVSPRRHRWPSRLAVARATTRTAKTTTAGVLVAAATLVAGVLVAVPVSAAATPTSGCGKSPTLTSGGGDRTWTKVDVWKFFTQFQ